LFGPLAKAKNKHPH